MQPVALRLLCRGHGAERPSLIQQLTEAATLYSRGLPCLADGPHPAFLDARDDFRDIYRIGECFTLKLCRCESENQHKRNHREAYALQKAQRLRQTPTMYFDGDCTIEGSDSVTLQVKCLLLSYGGPSFATLMQKHFSSPYDHTVAEFIVTAYHDLAMLALAGSSLQIAYSNLLADNVSTLTEPTKYVSGDQVHIVIVNAEGVVLDEFSRPVFNDCCDATLTDFGLHCAWAAHSSWHFVGEEVHTCFHRFFEENGQEDLDIVTVRCAQAFRLLWSKICDVARTPQAMNTVLPSLDYARLCCGHTAADQDRDCVVCEEHYALRGGNIRTIMDRV